MGRIPTPQRHPRPATRIAGLVAATLAALAMAAPAAQACTQLGLNAGAVFHGSKDLWPSRLAEVRGAGTRVVRIDASWSGLEPTAPLTGAQPLRRWDALDARVDAITRAGMRPLLMLGYGTPWATAGREIMAAPLTPLPYVLFASAVATRYAPGSPFWRDRGLTPPAEGVAYEVWNEPNAEQFFRGQDDAPERYADLLLPTLRAIRLVDPAARVSSGGLVPITAHDFIRRVVARQPALVQELHAVGYHPYEPSGSTVVSSTRQFRRTLDALGMRRAHIEITEFGWNHLTLGEAARATETAVALKGLCEDVELRAGIVLLYVAMDGSSQTSYSLWTDTGRPTASVAAFRSVSGLPEEPRGRTSSTRISSR